MKTELMLNPTSYQEVFDHAVNHLRRQGSKSLAGDGVTCLYRGFNGKMCAAGPFITDEEAHLNEGKSIPAIIRGTSRENFLDLLGSLQLIHDRSDVWGWEYQFKRLASAYKLVYTEPE